MSTLDRINASAKRRGCGEQHLQTALRLIEYAVQIRGLADGYTVYHAAMIESSAVYLLAGMSALDHDLETGIINTATTGTPVATDSDRLNALLKVSNWIQAGMRHLHTGHKKAMTYFQNALALLLMLADNHSEVFKTGEREAYFNAAEGIIPAEVGMCIGKSSLDILDSVEGYIRLGCLIAAQIELYFLLRRIVATSGSTSSNFDAALEHNIAYGLYAASALSGLDELGQATNAITDARSCLQAVIAIADESSCFIGNGSDYRKTFRNRVAQALIHMCKAMTNIEGGR